jgi:hypothetical protein
MDHLLEARQARLGKTQVLFRAVNDQVESLNGNGSGGRPVIFFCECANPDCGHPVALSLDDFRTVTERMGATRKVGRARTNRRGGIAPATRWRE